jgi:hypothetical protein
MRLEATVRDRHTVEHVTTTEYGADEPIWVVWLKRPGLSLRHSVPWFYNMIGWYDVHAEGPDLDAAIDEVLAKSEPRYVSLEERVWEHEDFKRACWLADQFDPLQPVA